jgi:ABC-type antimicrobial peptide transport system permease subunit
MSLGVLMKRNLVRSRKRAALVGSMITSGVAALLILGALSLGIIENVVTPLLPKLPVGLIRVEPKVLGLGMFAFDNKALGGGLDEKSVARLRQHPGVNKVYEVIGAGFPLRAQGGARLLGRGIRTDLFATGVPEALVKKDVAEGYEFKDPGPKGEIIPVLISRRLLDLYNTTVAQALGQPKLTQEAIIGFSAEIVLGSSYVRGTPDPSKVRKLVGQIVGFSDQATLVGVTVPEASIRRWNTIHAGGKMPIVSAYVEPKKAADAAAITQKIESLGLGVDETQKLIGAATVVLSALAILVALGFLGLAAFSMAQTFLLMVNERRYELASLRAMGARQKDIFYLVMIESMIISSIAAGLGILVGVLGAHGLDLLLFKLIGNIPFRPSSFIHFSTGLVLGVLCLGSLSGGVGAFIPAYLASKKDPIESLRH